ncbi:SNF2 family N-terminal domain-containing protein [Obelidium mucronatum]|nr:SNF2 family N-terminal domain-containing protein [Obelidium mucronatum]
MDLHKPNSPYWQQRQRMPMHPIMRQQQQKQQPAMQKMGLATGMKDGDMASIVNAFAAQTLQDVSDSDEESEESNQHEEEEEEEEEPEEEPLVIDGLKVSLLPHQVQGVKWLIEKEKIGKGGCILADDMGLGKTVQIIGLMLAAKPGRSEASKTTLIIAPVSLLNQWKNEIESKTEPGSLSVLMHHGKSRAKSVRELTSFDVVLTTYGLVTSSCKEESAKEKNGYIIEDSSDDERAGGILMSASFFRIVLDEAHTIKNAKSKGSRACAQLRAEKRVCLTGTPIHNNIEELFSLVRFLRIPLYETLSDFKRITKNNHHLQTLLSATMLRRTKKGLALDSIDSVNNADESTKTTELHSVPQQPQKSDLFTINLPEKTITDCRVQLSEEELRYYKEVEEKGQLKIKDAQNADSLNRMVVLSLLLRLRQICNHRLLPSLSSKDRTMESGSTTPVTTSKFESADSEDSDVDSLDAMVSKMTLTSAGNSRPVMDLPFETRRVLPNFKKAFPEASRPIIDLTRDSPPSATTSVILTLPSCISCGLTLLETCDDLLCQDCAPIPVEDFDEDLPVPPAKGNSSSKINKIIEIIQTRLKKAPGEKFIVFSQWTSTFKVLDKALKEKRIKFIQYDGKMSSTTKADALRVFENDSSITVCLMSLMCGAVGLNLTCANNVILTDLWWNPMLEDQAIDRVYRIGQKKPVFIHRMIVADSVEERIVILQNKKRQLVEHTIGGKEGFKPKKLSMGELVALFGVKL